MFIDLGGQGGISFILPFLMFIFLLALGEDYNILVMTRIREEARAPAPARSGGQGDQPHRIDRHLGRGHPRRERSPCSRSSAAAGREASQLRAIGFGLAAGILMDTFLVRTLLVPSTVMLLGSLELVAVAFEP